MNEPKIRFKGYTDDWEQRKVSELCSISTGKSNTQDKVEDGEYPFYVRSPIIERSTKYLYDEEAVLTVGDGVGTGKVFHYVNGKYDLHQRCYRMYDFADALNARYFYHTFSRLFYKRVMAMTAKTSVDSVRLEMIADMEILCPDVKEQEQIGAYFTNLDTLITLHHRKYEETKILKKYMLQKMFPKDGENVPEIRFAGFTDAWEQRKLGELVEVGDIDHRMPPSVDDGIPYLMTGDFCGINELNFEGVKHVSQEDYEMLSRKIKPELGDIIFARYASVGAVRYVDFTRDFLISYSCAIIKKGKKIDSKFLYHFLISDIAQKQIQLEINIGSQANIGIDSMKNNIYVSMPSNEEQIKISEYLSSIDNLITLHHQKCKELQNIKKFMLQNMFI